MTEVNEETTRTNLDEELYSSVRPEAPAFNPTVRMKDYGLSERFNWVKLDPPALGTVLTMDEVARLFRMPKRSAQRLVQRHLLPGGGVEKNGRRYLIAAWAIRKLVGVHNA